MLIAILQPLLAANGFGGVMCVAVIVMMFVGWILNMVNANKRPAPAARRPRQPSPAGDDRLQSEIDSFLQEVGGGKRRRRPSPVEREEEVELEIIEERQPPRRRPRRRPQSQPVKPMRPAAEDVSTPLSERHLQSAVGSQHLGDELQTHVSQYMHDDIGQTGPGGNVGSAWTQTGEANAGSPATVPSGDAVAPRGIADLLRNPATVRQAILVNEILSPPKSRRG